MLHTATRKHNFDKNKSGNDTLCEKHDGWDVKNATNNANQPRAILHTSLYRKNIAMRSRWEVRSRACFFFFSSMRANIPKMHSPPIVTVGHSRAHVNKERYSILIYDAKRMKPIIISFSRGATLQNKYRRFGIYHGVYRFWWGTVLVYAGIERVSMPEGVSGLFTASGNGGYTFFLCNFHGRRQYTINSSIIYYTYLHNGYGAGVLYSFL